MKLYAKEKVDMIFSKNAQNSVEKLNWRNHSILQKNKNKKIKKFRKRADPPCECQKRGGGVWFALYRCKSLKINTLFATKRDILRQKYGFFVSVFVSVNYPK